jgi:hypothetical protein
VSPIAILILGIIVTAITGTGAVLVGLQEAADPRTRTQDLSELEKKVTGRDEGSE